jgi:hypothetical protein
MKKILASASLVALGAASLQAAPDAGLTPQEKSKPWTVGLTLRGFYDDNYLTAPTDAANDLESFGIDLRPFAGLNLNLDQTYIGLNYTYGMRYYEDRESDTTDQSHDVRLVVKHEFTEKLRLDVSDNFRYSTEPQITDGSVAYPLRTDQQYMYNLARIALGIDVTEKLGFDVYFNWTLWDYDDDGFPGSLDALLSRMEYLPGFNARYAVNQQTTLLGGYQYEMVNYTSDDSLSATGPYVSPEVRNRNSHFLYGGIKQTFTSKLEGTLKAGAQFSDYPDAEAGMEDNETTPYFDGVLTYRYNPGSNLDIGVRYQLNATDVAFQNSTTPTRDQESFSLYTAINHRLSPRLSTSLLALYQNSEFIGGSVDGENDQFYVLGASFNYAINAFLSAELGYNFDRLDSDIPNRSYTRNRCYLGLVAKY